MKFDKPFGVLLIKEGNETGDAATFYTIGTLAKIVDFNQLEDGLLGITCEGLERFRVNHYSVKADQLVVGKAEPISDLVSDEMPEKLSTRFNIVTKFLRKNLRNSKLKLLQSGALDDWNCSSWISFKAAEILPLSHENRQLLLEMDIAERIYELSIVLEDNKLV